MSTSDNFWTIDIDPHIYCGIVLDADEETIPFALAQRLRIDGELTLWEFQAGWNHNHPALRGLAEIRNEIETFKLWERILNERFPDESFVIEQCPLESMTWYQPGPGAPQTDADDWEPAPIFREVPAKDFLAALKSKTSPVEGLAEFNKSSQELANVKAKLQTVVDVRLHPEHRGVLIATDSTTGETVAYATRTIRTLIGPTPG